MIWFLGDQFAFSTFYQHYHQRKDGFKSYIRENIEVPAYCKNDLSSTNRSVISRLRNALVEGIKEHIFLPKMVIIVPDLDITKFMGYNHPSFEAECSINKIIHWLMKEFNTLVDIQKDYLPSKSKRLTHPPIYLD